MRVTFKDRWNKVNFVEQKNNQDDLGNQQQHNSAIESQTKPEENGEEARNWSTYSDEPNDKQLWWLMRVHAEWRETEVILL